MAATIDSIIADPQWVPHAFDDASGRAQFLKFDRDTLVREAFLDGRAAASAMDKAVVPWRDAATAAAALPDRRPRFIFHTAFCCSTLLARALDKPGAGLSLKEPEAIMAAANFFRVAPRALGPADDTLSAVLRLLARPHQGDEDIIIKPTNTANNLLPHIARRGLPVLLLYGDLHGFLVSVLKKGEACKAFIRKQYTIFALDPASVGAIPERQALGLTDLQIAALVWRCQMELFTRALQQYQDICSLDFRRLLADPQGATKAVARHFDLSHGDADIARVAAGPIFKTDAKFADKDYDRNVRAQDEALLLERHGGEIAMIEGWAMQLRLTTYISAAPPKPLF